MVAGGTLIRNLTDPRTGSLAAANNSPVVKCGYHALSDGTAVSIVADVGAIYVYKHSTQDMSAVITLAATVTNDTVTGDAYIYGSSLDTANGIHIAWRSHGNAISYVHYAYSAGGYPVETNRIVTLIAGTATNKAIRLDMDCAGSGTHQYTVVGGLVVDSSGSSTSLALVVVDDSAKVKYQTSYTLGGGGVIPTNYSDDLVVNCEKNGTISGAGYIKIAVVYCRNWTTRADSGDILAAYKFTVSGNTFSAGGTLSIPSQGKGGGLRRYGLFSGTADTVFYLAGGALSGFYFAYSFTLDASCNIVTRTVPSTHSADHSNATSFSRNFLGFNRYGNTVIIYSQTFYNAYVVEQITFNGTNQTTTWFDNPEQWQNNPGSADYSPGCIVGGNTRNPIPQMGTIAFWNSTLSGADKFAAFYQAIGTAKAPVQVIPAAGTKFTNGFPVFSTRYKLAYDIPQVQYKVRWQYANDAGFTQNVGTVDSLSFTTPFGVGPSGADERNIGQPTLGLISGTWYIRSSQIDNVGNQSLWSPAVQFSVASIPSANSLAPNGDYVATYGTGNVMFSWLFTDSSPSSQQTSYQIIVNRVSDNATVVDTGKTASTSNSASVAIPSVYKDTRLQWTLYLWDTDNQQSVALGPATFYASDPPVPVLTFPTDGSTITSGYPNVTWNPGITGVKTQLAYRVQLIQGRVTLYDSGTVNSTGNSQQIPAGMIQTGQNYTVRLVITDSLDQTSITVASFATAYTPPAASASLSVYLYEFERKGFVFCGWTNALLDVDFLMWNLYRQEIGGSTVVLDSFLEDRPAYGFRDSTAKANTRYRYWVTQVVNRYGDIIESLQGTIVTVNTGGSNYWLSDSANILDPVPLLQVTDDTWTDEHEESVSNVIGRGRHVDTGTHWGVNGTLTCHLRDKPSNLTSGYNWCANPSFHASADGINPDNWTFSSTGSFATRYDNFFEPLPSGRNQALAMLVDQLAVSGAGNASCSSSVIQLASTDMTAGSNVYASSWVTDDPNIPVNVNPVRMRVRCYNSVGTQIQGNTQVATVIDTYEPPLTGDLNTGNWSRYGITLSIPAATVSVQVDVFYYNNTASLISGTIYFTGIMVHSGTVALPYFDGDTIGGKWADKVGGYSYNLGQYFAHDQRADIKEMKETNRPLFLRTPFGENYQVSVGDDGNTRIPGVGVRDFDDITIPYREIAF